MNGIPEEHVPALCMAVGYISINWAMVERQMDNCIHLIFADLGGVPGEAEKPISLSRKIEYLKKAFNKNSRLIGYKYRVRDLLKESKETGDKRHIFLHGTLSGLEGTILTIDKMTPKAADYEIVKTSFNFLDFPALADEFLDLTTRWGELAGDLLKQFRKP